MPVAARLKYVSLYEIAGRALAGIGCLEVIQNLGIGILNAMRFALCPLRSELAPAFFLFPPLVTFD